MPLSFQKCLTDQPHARIRFSFKPFLSIRSYCRELASQSIIVSTIAPNIVATVVLVIKGERTHRGSIGIFDSPNGCIGQEPVLACAKLTGVVEKHVLLEWVAQWNQ